MLAWHLRSQALSLISWSTFSAYTYKNSAYLYKCLFFTGAYCVRTQRLFRAPAREPELSWGASAVTQLCCTCLQNTSTGNYPTKHNLWNHQPTPHRAALIVALTPCLSTWSLFEAANGLWMKSQNVTWTIICYFLWLVKSR